MARRLLPPPMTSYEAVGFINRHKAMQILPVLLWTPADDAAHTAYTDALTPWGLRHNRRPHSEHAADGWMFCGRSRDVPGEPPAEGAAWEIPLLPDLSLVSIGARITAIAQGAPHEPGFAHIGVRHPVRYPISWEQEFAANAQRGLPSLTALAVLPPDVFRHRSTNEQPFTPQEWHSLHAAWEACSVLIGVGRVALDWAAYPIPG